MLKTIIVLLISINTCLAGNISGEVSFKGKSLKGTLFIFAKKFNSKMPMPLAVKKIESPKFPLKFTLSANDAMMKSIPFEGPFVVIARLSPSGDALDKSGLEAKTDKAIKIGDKDIKLILNNN